MNSRRFYCYVLTGDKLGGWVQPHAGVSSYWIDATRGGHPAIGIKALLYAPNCAIQALDVSLLHSNNDQYSFVCRPLSNLWITGKLIPSDWLDARQIRLQAKYVARWAQPLLGLEDDILVTIPVGEPTYLSADGGFHISVPDFSRDALAAPPNHPGELQIWAEDKETGETKAQLTPAGPQIFKTRMGGLQIQSQYPSEIAFTQCAVNPEQLTAA